MRCTMVDVLSMTNSDEKAIKLASHQTRSDLREPIALDGQTSATVLDVSISTREGWNVFLLDCSIQWKTGGWWAKKRVVAVFVLPPFNLRAEIIRWL